MIPTVKRGSTFGFVAIFLLVSLSSEVSALAAPRPDHPVMKTAAASAETALREAVWDLERALRDHLAVAARPGDARADTSPASGQGGNPPENLAGRWHGLRRAAEGLTGSASVELLGKLQALRPLLRALEMAGAGLPSGQALAAPWQGPDTGSAPGLDASSHGRCASPREVQEGEVFTSELSPGAEELWLRHRAEREGVYAVSTAGSSFDTVVEIYSSCPETGGRLLRRGDDEIGLQSRSGYRAAAGEQFWVRIQAWHGAAGSLIVEVAGELTVLTGRMTRESDGSAIRNERVEVWDASGSFAASDSTDSDGAYLVFGLAAGTYFVSTEVDFYAGVLDELYDDIPCFGGAFDGCLPTEGTPVLLEADEITAGIDFALSDGGSVSGRVRDAVSGLALPGFNVDVYAPSGAFLHSTYSDATGRFLAEGLPPGDVLALVGSDSFNGDSYPAQLYRGLPCSPSCDPTTGSAIPVEDGETTLGIDFLLTPLGSLEGTLTDALTGAPIDFEDVFVYDSAGSFSYSAFTDSQGRYRAAGLSAGTYFVLTSTYEGYSDELYDNLPCEPSCDPATGTPVAVTDGASTSGIDFALIPFGSLSGTVSDAATGTGLPYGNVRLWDSTGSSAGFTHTDFAGDYRFSSLSPGTYFVTTSERNYLDELYDGFPCEDGCDVTAGTPVVVQSGVDSSDIDFGLLPLGAIEGVVTDATTDDPLSSFTVQVWDETGGYVASRFGASGGGYRIDGLDAGTYFVSIDAQLFVAKRYDDLSCPGGPPSGCDATTGSPVTVTLGASTTGIDFALLPQGSLSGTVRREDGGAPIRNASVQVYDASGGFFGSTYTDGSGSYRIHGMDDGDYFVRAATEAFEGELYEDLPCPALQCDPTTGSPVAVRTAAETSGIDFSLAAKATVAGSVTTSTGEHLYSASLEIYDTDGILSDWISLRGSGPYSVPMDAGTWFLVARGDSNFVPELYDGISCPSSSCDVTAGTPVVVPAAGEVSGIDFELDVARGIVGQVMDGRSGLPLVGVAIDLWDDQGNRIDGRATGPTGFFHFRPGTGTYFLSSDNGLGRQDEIWNDVPCPEGSAFNGLCDPLAGDAVILGSFRDLAGGIDFELIVVEIFADGFETGDTSAWSASVP